MNGMIERKRPMVIDGREAARLSCDLLALDSRML